MSSELAAEIAGGVDRELARSAQAGEISALEQLLARHRPGMLGVALIMLSDSPRPRAPCRTPYSWR